jgi:carbamoyltransferase
MDIAASIQEVTEEIMLRCARHVQARTGMKRLCLAGGVALNCKMNGEIHRRGLADDLFVQPLAYDGGVSLGAAQVLAAERGDDPRFAMDHIYWGPAYSNDRIEADLRASRVAYRRSDGVAREAARMIADGRIVGWFQGRMEGGPRALGGRSILADPRRPEMKDLVNDRVKFREGWRPFALSILEEHFADYAARPARSPFMIMAFDVAEAKRGDIPSAMHSADHTTRPQTVSRKTNPLYWELLEAFRGLTGVPGVLNTSFNVKDEPIVCTPRDALRCFYGTGMDSLVIGDFILEKPAS